MQHFLQVILRPFSLENNIVNLGLPIQGTPNGQEILSVNIPGNSVYDSTGNAATSTLVSFTLYNKEVSQISTTYSFKYEFKSTSEL